MIEFISMNNASNNLTDITFHMFAELSSKPDIQKLCSFSREGNAFFTKSKSPVAEYISKIRFTNCSADASLHLFEKEKTCTVAIKSISLFVALQKKLQ